MKILAALIVVLVSSVAAFQQFGMDGPSSSDRSGSGNIQRSQRPAKGMGNTRQQHNFRGGDKRGPSGMTGRGQPRGGPPSHSSPNKGGDPRFRGPGSSRPGRPGPPRGTDNSRKFGPQSGASRPI